MDDTKIRRRESAEPCRVATVSPPEKRARLAKIAPRINFVCGNDAYCINDLARAVKERVKATALKHASSSHPRGNIGFAGEAKDDMCHSGDTLHRGTMSSVGWSDAALGDQSTERKFRLRNVIG